MLKKIVFFLIIFIIFSCSSDDDGSYEPIENPPDNNGEEVSFEIDKVPYTTLSEYNFYEENIANLKPIDRVVPYELISPLFTDYAKKKRFVWMPEDVSATYNSSDKVLDFPNSTILIKNFYYNNVQPNHQKRIVETRLMFKKDNVWEFANYIWNNQQTEAYLDLSGSTTLVEWTDENNNNRSVNYRIPSATECMVCHKSNEKPIPIGLKPHNLNKTFTYPTGEKNQLQQLVDVGYLNSYPGQIETVVDWENESGSLKNRVRSYLDINCAHCHSEGAHCDYRPLKLAYSETIDDINLGVCVEPDQYVASGLPYIVAAGKHERSMMFYRMNATDEAVKMPLLGRTVVHQESVDLLSEWIDNINQNCP
ncbi:hypothetical protein [Mesonia aquimarina]|uniref:hypothetical protein n=1 Tax=Mesonia aquimarina TaxID=1504967 RepID=UPI000EF5D90C|nr:hypothetical protein [Mesonia aquimarina]